MTITFLKASYTKNKKLKRNFNLLIDKKKQNCIKCISNKNLGSINKNDNYYIKSLSKEKLNIKNEPSCLKFPPQKNKNTQNNISNKKNKNNQKKKYNKIKNPNEKKNNQKKLQNQKKAIISKYDKIPLKSSHKPPRAHHCSICKTCALKMDHHCPFIGNCVGQNNYRYYFQLLFLSVISLSIMFVVYIYSANFYLSDLKGRKAYIGFCWLFWGFVLMAVFLALVACFFLFRQHLFFVLGNLGTIQGIKGGNTGFDFGRCSNLEKIFGGFFLPVGKRYRYEGYFFPVKGMDRELCDLSFFKYRYNNCFFKNKVDSIEDLIIKMSIKKEEDDALFKNTYIFGDFKFELEE